MELRHALAVTLGEGSFDESSMPDEEDLPSVCAGLIYVEEGSQIVRLAHYTAQDYLETIRDTKFTNARRLVAGSCLTYLSYHGNRLCHQGLHYVYCFDSDGYSYEAIDVEKACPYGGGQIYESSRDVSDSETSQSEYFYHDVNGMPLALYRYAAHHWARHIKSHLEETLEDLAMRFLLDDLNRRLALGVVRTLWWITRIKGPLTVMVHYDFRHLCRTLLKKQTFDLEYEDGEGYRALLSAAELGRSHIIKAFLEQTNLQALVDSERTIVLTPLAWVAWAGDRLAV